MWWTAANRQRLGQLEDAVRELRAAVARFEATDVARTAATIEASARLQRASERLRKQVDRHPPVLEDGDDTDDDFYDRLLAKRGGA